MISHENILKDFPELASGEYHYLDSSASSLTPTPVTGAVEEYYRNYRANTHRGLYKEAVRATETYEEVREKVARWIGAESAREIIFTSGATESSNMIAGMLQRKVREGANIVTTVMEHHSAFLPLRAFAQRQGVEFRLAPLSGIALDVAELEHLVDKNTVILSVMLASNVTGVVNDIARIAKIAHRVGAFLVVDATAGVGHIPLHVFALGVDALYFSGHKMFAPTGVGVLWVREEHLKDMEPAFVGGHMIDRFEGDEPVWADAPARFEAGTKNIGGVIGLGSAIDYIEEIGLPEIHAHNSSLAMGAISELGKIEGVRAYALPSEKNTGVVSFTCDFAHPHDIAEVLARSRVAVRPGHHCAIPLHRALGITATTRASFHVYNTEKDVEALVSGIREVKKLFT